METQPVHAPLDANAESQASISAYYSLVFPNFTYFLQTLNVTIGRRCLPANNESSSSSSDKTQVDVDLGPLKSVSRLHAKIEYEEGDERFVLVVVGRNGAWVDGVWSGSGSRVPLSERSQIQIASRTFHFVLPPPPPLPEDSPSPSDDAYEHQRARSPSVDIISHSPPSSLTSHSPPPPAPAPITKPSAPPKAKATNPKKRKKSEQAPPPPKPPKPEVMPPKPQLTYSIMCYRAIKALGGKATLQDICGWMRETFDWYKYNDEAGWENSVRHNLSSNRAFKKMERCAGERGKGFFWSVEESHIQSFEDQEAKNAQALAQQQQQAAGGSQLNGGKMTAGKNKKGGAALHEPPLKRSVKLGHGPLPPPLTTTPLPMKSSYSPAPGSLTSPSPAPPFSNAPAHHPAHAGPSHSGANSAMAMTTSTTTPNATATPATHPSTIAPPPNPTEAATTAAAQSTSFISSLPPSVCIPIVIGQAPPSAIASASASAHLPTPPIVLHDNTLILNPSVFSHLAPEQLKELEALGAQKALEILQSYIVRFLKERIRGEKGGDRGRGRQRGRPKRGGIGGSGRGGTPGGSGPFTNTPLPNPSQNGSTQTTQAPQPATSSAGVPGPDPKSMTGVVQTSVDSKSTVPVSAPAPAPVIPISAAPARSVSPIIVVDDEPDDEPDGPAMKRRRLDGQGGAVAV